MANKKISDFSAVKDADVNNMTAIAGVGTDGQDQANQNVKISGAELISSLNIPTNNNELTNGANYITAASLPTVNNGQLTITVDGTATTFTANEAGNKSVSITTGGSSAIDSGTTTQMLAIANPVVGQQFLNTDYAWVTGVNPKIFVWSGVRWYVPGETIIYKKVTDQACDKGMLLDLSLSATGTTRIATDAEERQLVGISVYDEAQANDTVVVAIAGVWPILCSPTGGAIPIRSFLDHDGTTGYDGYAAEDSAGSGVMAIAIEDASSASLPRLVYAQLLIPAEVY